MCNNWPNFPKFGATGGLIGDTVIICGGVNRLVMLDECYSLTSEKATLVTHMSVGRGYAASIVINDNSLWVTGGYTDGFSNGDSASTEYVTMTGTILGPDLPMTLYSHAMVAINSTCSMVIGGYSYDNYDNNGYSASTLFYDHKKGEWITGPSLMQARRSHAAGIVTDEELDENFVAVTGGYGPGYFDSTEILQDGEWVQGKLNDTICYFL
jgi:hypothetical protein